MTIHKSAEMSKILSFKFLVCYLLISVVDVLFTYLFNLDMTLLVYIGPFASALYISEEFDKRMGVKVQHLIRLKLFWLNTLLWQILYLTYTIEKGDLNINGVGIVFLLQVLFVCAGCISSRAYQWVRARN